VTGLEHLQLGQHPGIADRGRHRFEVLRRVDENVRPHVHAAHVEAANIGLELDHVPHPFRWRLHRGPSPGL